MWRTLIVVAALGCAGPTTVAPTVPRFFATEAAAITAPRPMTAPPPIAGGTLLITRDGLLAIAVDRDRDLIWRVDLEGDLRVRSYIPLRAGDRPGRVLEDASGRVHVVLRGAGAVFSFDPYRPIAQERRRVCPAPRGIAADGARLHVACAGGELLTLMAAGGPPIRARRLHTDLRDIGVDEHGLWSTRFRSAELVRPLSTGAMSHRLSDHENVVRLAGSRQMTFAAAVAWRTIPDAHRGHWMLHQWELKDELDSEQLDPVARSGGHYYGDGVIRSAVTRWQDDAASASYVLPGSVLPVDIVAIDDDRLAIAAAGTQTVVVLDTISGSTNNVSGPMRDQRGPPIAVAYHPAVGLLVQRRDRPALEVLFDTQRGVGQERWTFLGEPVAADLGHQVFHASTNRQVACASCHPEGGDDGHVWRLDSAGPRRTQTITGGILDTAPFHWRGDVEDFGALMNLVFVERMGGDGLTEEAVHDLGLWVDGIEDAPGATATNRASADRGRALFDDSVTACSTCHSGARGTDGLSHDVGTGGMFQTPPLVGLAARPPYFHDGCADRIEERFSRCHTVGHGGIEHLAPEQLADLGNYLRTL